MSILVKKVESNNQEMASMLSPSPSSSSSSSIGRNSDDEEDNNGDEAESTYKMESLEEVLPIRKGISKFYNGKSKSFTSLTESVSNMKDVAKPENPYSRRRRNHLCHQMWENKMPRGGGISKKAISSSKSALTLAMAVAAGVMSNGSSSSSSSGEDLCSVENTKQRCEYEKLLPPLYPRSRGSFGHLKSSQSSLGFCGWRSYSVADFPMCLPASES